MAGGGDLAQPGDATWVYRSFPEMPRTTPRGQFVVPASASITVSTITQYQWSGAGLLNGVVAWHNGTAPNHGWLLKSPERSTRPAKRFDSREIEHPALAPRLEVTFQPPARPGRRFVFSGLLGVNMRPIAARAKRHPCNPPPTPHIMPLVPPL